jgi:hypothetical protein
MAAYGADMAKEFGVAGFYVRTSPASAIFDGQGALGEFVPIRNRNDGLRMRTSEQINTDFLRLVRSVFATPPIHSFSIPSGSCRVSSKLACVTQPRGAKIAISKQIAFTFGGRKMVAQVSPIG